MAQAAEVGQEAEEDLAMITVGQVEDMARELVPPSEATASQALQSGEDQEEVVGTPLVDLAQGLVVVAD